MQEPIYLQDLSLPQLLVQSVYRFKMLKIIGEKYTMK